MKASKLESNIGSPKHAFTNKDAHPLVLNLLLVKEFGPEYFGWEPETCWLEIKRTWGTTVSEANKNKIQAVRTCHTTSQPYERWEMFDIICSGLVGLTPKFELIQKPTPHRAAFAIDVMSQIKEATSISTEVKKYVAACMLDYGMVYGHGPLEPCNQYLMDFVSREQQLRVKSALDKKYKPKFDGTNDDDVQIMKSVSVKDFLETSSRMLLIQLKRLLP